MQWYFYIYKCNGRELKLKIRKQLNVFRKIGRTKKNPDALWIQVHNWENTEMQCYLYISYMCIKKEILQCR